MLKSTEQSNALREITLLRRVRAEAGYSTLVMRGQSNQTIFIWRLETAKPICLSSIDARAITANYFGRHQNLKAPEQARERAYAATKLTRFGSYDSQGLWKGYSQFGNRFLFTGREWSELGSRDIDGRAERPRERARTSQWLTDLRLYDFRNRMYQPELGRFLQPDPKEFAAGDYNLYRYCHNDPVNRSDPFGLIDRDIDRELDRKGVEASLNSLKAVQEAKDGAARSQAIQEKDGKLSLGKITKGKTDDEVIKRSAPGGFRTYHLQKEGAIVDKGSNAAGVGHVHMDKTAKADPNFSDADYGTARGSAGHPGTPVYKVNESNPSRILRLTPQADYRDEPTIRPVSP